MKIATGAHLNHYEIVALLGVGGMGEVYKASDTRLGRPVALKILPAHLVADADRVRRFIQEAKSASALNHPHIITIYEIGEAELEDPEVEDQGEKREGAGRVHYIAMEFVDGSTLHQKIHRDRGDLKKLLEYFAQAGDGLAKAHAAGIVHRDLKPENIMITEDGYAKILDFGLAKLMESSGPSGEELEEAATAMMGQTRPGMVMGTVGYMSPEQAQGKSVDQRSDIFSFGCILYEASTGRKPFTGDSVIDSLHKIVYMQAPPIRETNPNAPAELQRIVRKCLAKDPADRYQSIRDVAVDLRDLLREYDSQQSISASFQPPSGSYAQAPSTDSHSQFAPTMMHPQSAITGSQEALSSGAISGAASMPEVKFAPPRKSNRSILIGAGLLVLAIAAAAYFFIAQKQRAGKPGVPFQTTRINKLTSTGKASGAVISPDGKYVAHFLVEAGQPSVWVRQVATTSNVQIVPPAEASYVGLTFSRDGNYVYYVRAPKGENIRALYQVPVLGGSAKQIVEDVDSAITFSPDGKRFAFVRGYTQEGETALIVANADGTEEQKLAVKKQPDILVQPVWSPDGKIIACSSRSMAGGYHMEIVEIQVASGAERTITPQKWLFIGGLNWLSDGSGFIISALEETPTSGHTQIWKVSYPAGEARRITNDLNDYTGVSISADSTAMVTVQVTANSSLWVAPNGDATRAKQITSGSNAYDNSLSWTPDGKIVYVTSANGPPDIWIMDSDGKNQRQLTSGAGVNIFSSVSPDGRFILFDSSRNSSTLNTFYVWRMNIDGTNPKQLTFGGNEYYPVSSADGKWVIYNSLVDNGKPSLWRAPIDGGDPVRLTDYVSARPAISPDGKLIACQYHDNQPTSPVKIALVPIEGGQPIKVLNKQSSLFEWSSDGKAVIYLDTKGGVSNLWSMPIDGGAPRQLTNFNSDLIFTFDWSPDGKQLVCARGVQTTDVILIKDLGQEGKE